LDKKIFVLVLVIIGFWLYTKKKQTTKVSGGYDMKNPKTLIEKGEVA
jgi:hypothetical protein